jgi:hypothetical protein
MPEETNQSLRPQENPRRTVLASLGNGLWDVFRSRAFWRVILILCAVNLLVCLLLGVWVYFIVFSCCMVIIRLTAVYAPARRLAQAVTGLVNNKYIFRVLNASLWGKVVFLIPALFWVGAAGVGMWLLLRTRFLEQNLIYLMFVK